MPVIIAIRVIENDYRTDTLVDHENEWIVPSPVFSMKTRKRLYYYTV